MSELYYYKESTDEVLSITELTDVDFIKAVEVITKEADLRVYDTLPPFDTGLSVLKTDLVQLQFSLLFKDWTGLVPRKIGVWA